MASADEQWPLGKPVEKVLFPVSDRTPIVTDCKVHPTCRRAAYDMHFALELGIVLSGRMEREYRDFKFTLGSGGVWYCGIWEPHGWSVLRAPCRVVVLLVLPQIMNRLRLEESSSFDPIQPFMADPAERPQPAGEELGRVKELGERIWSICAERPLNHELWLHLLFQECLLLLNKQPGETRTRLTVEHAGQINRVIETVCRSRRLVTVDEAAVLAGMSKAMFNKAFESMIGISFAKYGLRYRLNGAATMLAQSDEPLKGIAYEWGFTDASHLHRCFVQHYGCGPKDYRERSRAHGKT